jgi:hypothetical protein
MPEKLGFLRLLLVSVFAESSALNPRKCFKLLFIISSPLKVFFTTTQVNQMLVPIFEGITLLGRTGAQPIRSIVVYPIATTMVFMTRWHLRYVDFEGCRVRFAIDPLFY